MDMQDKELDMLFKQQLDDLEIQPSASVWQGISSELNTNRRKRILLPLLSAAAGVILLITAGILFIPKQHVKVDDKQHSNRVADATKPVKQPVVKTAPIVPPTLVPNKTTVSPVIAPVNAIAKTNKPKTKSNLTQPVQQPGINNKPSVDAPADQPMLAQTPVVNYNVIKTTGPDTAVTISPKPVVLNNEKPQQALIAQADTQPLPTATKPVKKHHRIRSLGDVFNVMIAAVDKRKDKVIEFTNTDEDDATITGVNLGFIKVKKEKDK